MTQDIEKLNDYLNSGGYDELSSCFLGKIKNSELCDYCCFEGIEKVRRSKDFVFKSRESTLKYLYKAAYCVFLDYCRKEKYRERTLGYFPEIVDHADDKIGDFENRQQLDVILKLARLDSSEIELLNLCCSFKKHEDVGMELGGVSAKNITDKKYLILKKIRNCLIKNKGRI